MHETCPEVEFKKEKRVLPGAVLISLLISRSQFLILYVVRLCVIGNGAHPELLANA